MKSLHCDERSQLYRKSDSEIISIIFNKTLAYAFLRLPLFKEKRRRRKDHPAEVKHFNSPTEVNNLLKKIKDEKLCVSPWMKKLLSKYYTSLLISEDIRSQVS